jgi:hypothetical protein
MKKNIKILLIGIIIVLVLFFAFVILQKNNENKEEIFCADAYAPVCGIDGITYPNECYAEIAGIEIEYLGKCIIDKKENQTFCTEEYVPVCGIDETTYSNACYAEIADIEIDYPGECIFEEIYPEKYNNIVIDAINLCENSQGFLDNRSTEEYNYLVCVFQDFSECELEKLFNEECFKGDYITDPEKACTMEYNPVCGINGVTYSNPCMAGDIPVVKEGSC